jgi:hypothetical protein
MSQANTKKLHQRQRRLLRELPSQPRKCGALAVGRRRGLMALALIAAVPAGVQLQSDNVFGAPLAASSGACHLIERARASLACGHHLEHRDSSDSVDRYYETAVHAFAAVRLLTASGAWNHRDAAAARDVYNEGLRDCLRAAQRFGRVDPASHLVINTPAGAQTVPIVHRGFVWSPADFVRLIDPTRIGPNPHQHGVKNFRQGLGADLAVARPNPQVTAADRLLPREATFNATAILRPDLEAWLGRRRGTVPADHLELIDPLRVRTVTIENCALPLAANYDAAHALAYQIQAELRPVRFSVAGFARPSEFAGQADIKMLEPYQPGKIPVLFIHGLLDDPFGFSVMIAALNRTPGFLDRYQVWVYVYPTGFTFLRAAALLRSDLRDAFAVLDPDSRDPALQNAVIVGYSMGGLLARLQVTSSGDALRSLLVNRPLESLVMTPSTRAFVRELVYFEPSPHIRRVIFIATPHSGSPVASSIVGRLATRVVQPPSDSLEVVAQVERDNPGALSPVLQGRLPSSVDMLRTDNPLSAVLRQLPFSPLVTLHTIAGHGPHPPERARGDLVVPLASAHLDETVSEHWVPAIHINITYHPQTIAEVRRILIEHAGDDPKVSRAH